MTGVISGVRIPDSRLARQPNACARIRNTPWQS
jgi:hypothetical protein